MPVEHKRHERLKHDSNWTSVRGKESKCTDAELEPEIKQEQKKKK